MNPFEILGNAKGIQEKIQQIQNDMAESTATGSSGGGIVTATVNGHFDLVSIQIDPVAVDPRDVPMLQDLIIAAHNSAMEKLRETAKEKIGGLTGGMFPL